MGARDDEREALVGVSGYRATLVQRAREHADDMRRYDDTEGLVSTLVEMANLLIEDAAALAREHPEPEITEEQARAVMTVRDIAATTGMSAAEVIATVKAIAEPLHGWQYGREVTLHSSTVIDPVDDKEAAMKLAWLHRVHKRHAPGPWVPVEEGGASG